MEEINVMFKKLLIGHQNCLRFSVKVTFLTYKVVRVKKLTNNKNAWIITYSESNNVISFNHRALDGWRNIVIVMF